MRKEIFRAFFAFVLIGSLFAANAISAFAEDATVTGSDVNLRSGPGSNYKVVDCLPRGTVVTVTDRSNSSWYAVTTSGGTSGFMASGYLSLSGGSDGSGIVIERATDANGYINAMYVRFRSSPSSSGSVLGEYNSGKEVTISGSNGGWTSCVIDGQSGYIASQYVSAYGSGTTGRVASSVSSVGSSSSQIDDPYADEPSGGVISGPYSDNSTEVSGNSSSGETTSSGGTSAPQVDDPYGDGGVISGGSSGGSTSSTPTPSTPAPTPTPSPTPTPTPAPDPTPSPSTDTESKSGYINGDYVNFRTGPSTSHKVIASYNKGKELTVTGISGEWTSCVIDGTSGYIFSQYVSYSEADNSSDNIPEDTGSPDNTTNVPSEPGYITGNNVRFRSAPSMTSDVLGELSFGNAVTITGTSGDWTACIYNNKAGYVYSQYVARGEYTPSTSNSSDGNNGSSGSVTGSDIVSFALQYNGWNYIWGGKDPSVGFDCSGFTYYVYQNFGYTLNRVANDQARNGVHVDPSDLQPGDILCFYSGSSYIGHVGLYIGDNMFIHAQNSATGVVITELSGYYASRGYEARRIL